MKQRLLYYLLLLTLLVTGSSNYAWGAEGDVIYSNDFSTKGQTDFATWIGTGKVPSGYSNTQIGRNGAFSIETGALVHTAPNGKAKSNVYDGDFGTFTEAITNATKAKNYVLSFDITLAITNHIACNSVFEISGEDKKTILSLYADHTRSNSSTGATSYGYIVGGNNAFATKDATISAKTNTEGSIGDGTKNVLAANINGMTGSKTYHVILDAQTVGIAKLTIKEGETTIVNEKEVSISAEKGLKWVYFTNMNSWETPSSQITIDNLSIVEGAQTTAAVANYTVKYVAKIAGVDTEIKTSEQRSGIVSNGITLTDEDKNVIIYNDVKYIYSSDNASSQSIANNNSTVVTVTFVEAPSYTYSVTDNLENTLASGSAYKGDNVTFYVPYYVFKDGKFYQSPKLSSGTLSYGQSTISNIAGNTTISVTYTEEENTNVVFFSEAENLTGITVVDDNFTNIRMSNGKTGYFADLTAFATLPAGYYTITAATRVGTTTFYKGSVGNGTEIGTLSSTGSVVTTTSEPFLINEATDIYTSTGSSNNYFDYVIIRRTGDAPMPGDYFAATELPGELSEYVSATLVNNKLTLTSTQEGYCFEKIKLNMSKGTASANAGSMSEKNVWTGNAREVELTLSEGAQLNSIIINDGTAPELETVNTIAEFKAAQGETKLALKDAEILWTDGSSAIVQDETAGISIAEITISGAQVGKVVNGTIAGKPWQIFMQSSDQTDYTTLSTAKGETTVYPLADIEEALSLDNACRMVLLKGVTITEEEGIFTATDKSGKTIKISDFLYEDVNENLKDGDILASLTGMTRIEGEDIAICPRSADDIVSGLIWKANDLIEGDDMLIELTSGNELNKLAELEAGDEIHIELASLTNPEEATPLYINTAAGKNIYTILLNQDNLDEGIVSFPITQDVVREINKHGLKINANANATIIYVEPGKYEAGDDDIWLSDEEATINQLIIGEAHFTDVREGDIVTMETSNETTTMTAAKGQNNSDVMSDEPLDDELAALLQDGQLVLSTPATGLSRISFVKVAERDDIFEVEENGDYAYDSYKQGEKVTVNGMIMTFGGNDSEGKEYEFTEQYPKVDNFGSATEGVGQAPVDDEGNAYDPEKENVPTKGSFFVFEPTKDGALYMTVGLKKGSTVYITEDGKLFRSKTFDNDFEGTTGAFPLEATKTYHVITNDMSAKFFGFKFVPNDENAKNVAKDIATFKLMAAGSEEGDTLLLNDAIVTYIHGDDVFVEDATGAIDFHETYIQYYVGQKLNGYIVGKPGFVSEKMPVPALLRTDGTKYGQFKVTEKVKPEPTLMGMEDTDDLMNVARFVKLEDLKVTRNQRGFKVLTDGEYEMLIGDRFGVFYELDKNIQSIEGIIGMDEEYNNVFWPTSKERVVLGKSDTHNTIKTLDFTTATYAENPTIVLSEEQAGTAYETGNAIQQKIYAATAPAEIAGDIAFQAVSNGDGKGWWIRSDKGGLWNYNATRSAAVLNMKAGYRVTFNTTQQADAVLTLTNAEGAPDGPFVYELSEDGNAYICYMLEDGNIGFCGNKSVGYISSIEIAAPKKAMEVAEYTVKFVDENGADIKEAVTRKTLAGLTAALTASDKAPVTIDGITYLYDSDNSADDEIAADGKSVIIVKFVKASSDLSYSVQETVNGKVVRETKGNDIQGAKLKVPYRRYNLLDGTIYQKGVTSKEYNYSFTLNANNQVETLEYAATDKTNVVFLTEGEDIDGATVSAHANVLIRASNSASGFAEKDLEIVKLSAGTYKMVIGCFDTSKAGNTATFTFAAGDNDLFSITSAGNNLSEVSSEEFTLTDEATIILKAGGSESKSIDYLFITSDNGSVVKGLSVELAHTASSWCDANKDTYFSDVDAEKEIVNNEAFNAAWQGAAYMQFNYYIPEGQTITSAILKFTVIGESRGNRSGSIYCVNASESLDYTAMAAGNQKVNLAGTKVADITFPKSASALIEQDVTETLKTIVAAGQSYIIFKVTGNPGRGEINGKGSEFAPTLTIATDGDATGINELKAARQFEDGAIYNLRGQKVSGTLKPGLYIKNGRKFVVK